MDVCIEGMCLCDVWPGHLVSLYAKKRTNNEHAMFEQVRIRHIVETIMNGANLCTGR
jgi:hypothetical protein